MMTRTGLSDFTTNGKRLAILSLLALCIGILSGFVAFILLRLIGLITHLAYDGRVGWSLIAPNPHHWGILSILVPVLGGLVVGLLAKYGSDKIRGHGIPEAIQAILENNSVMDARVAVFKPLASAITIGTGGPFGAEGPIIMTGGAVGSLVSQFFRLSSLERRTLLVAGAAGGMSATFGSPIAAVLLAVELLLFEWRPRSLIPVTIASAMAEAIRAWLIGTAPIFGTPLSGTLPLTVLIWALVIGVAAGLVSGVLTKLVYFLEDAYHKLPMHWVWWPALGGFAVGLGGLIDPRALGVGYPTIRTLDAGHLLWEAALILFVVKAVIWTVSLSSGTSGGVLAPLLLLGGALGMILSPLFPGHLAGVAATMGMAAMLGGTMRVPFTATIFALETTHNWALLLPVFVAAVAGMAVTVLWIPRSILTEKVARRGVHVAREYSVNPLESQSVRQVMVPRDQVFVLDGNLSIAEAAHRIAGQSGSNRTSYPVVDRDPDRAIGTIESTTLFSQAERAPDTSVKDLAQPLLTIGDWERVRTAVEQMARHNQPELVVVDNQGTWVGFMSQSDTFTTWKKAIAAEDDRQRIFDWPTFGKNNS